MNIRVEDPGNTAPIETLYAWCSVDDDGNEGIVAGMDPPMPLVSGDLEIMQKWKLFIDHISKQTGKKIVLKSFACKEVLYTVHNK